jgi:formylmethanofuran dehydrogenase subunit E
MKIRNYTFDEYVERVRAFHSFAAPGVLVGGFMVDLAYRHLPEEGLFDALCETPKCLPDAIQLLTPCTIGNGWLTIHDTGRYAMTLYEKCSGDGVRICMDAGKVTAWPEIKGWFLKLTPKGEQNKELLMAEIEAAGGSICSIQRVRVAERFLAKKHRGEFAICPCCDETYPLADGALCRGCQGDDLYTETVGNRHSSKESPLG